MARLGVWDDITQSYLEVDWEKVMSALNNLEFLKLPEPRIDPVFEAVTSGENVYLRVADIRQWTGLHPGAGETVEFTAKLQLINKG